MSLIYNAGCKYYLNRGPQDATTETLYRDCLVLTRISSYFGLLTPFLVIVCTMLHRYVLTKAFLTKCYGKSFASLDTRQQSAFRFHHIDLVVKTSSLMFTSRPTFKVFVRGQNWYDPFYNDSSFALGDSVSIGASIVAALFIFHICSAQRLKLLDFAHHAGAIFAIQAYPAWSTSQAIDEVLRLKEAKKMANTCLLWSKLYYPIPKGLVQSSRLHGGKKSLSMGRIRPTK